MNDIFMSIEEKRKKELESITTNYNTNSNNDNVMKWLNQNDNKQGNNKQGNNKQDNNSQNNRPPRRLRGGRYYFFFNHF